MTQTFVDIIFLFFELKNIEQKLETLRPDSSLIPQKYLTFPKFLLKAFSYLSYKLISL